MGIRTHLLAAAALVCFATRVSAKTLIYCSEGSPEGFDPAPLHRRHHVRCLSRPVFNRLVEFEPGGTEVVPGLAESWSVSDDGLEYTFKLRPGVKFHTTDYFTPTRDLNADDVIFSFDRQGNTDNPWNLYTEGASWEYFNSMGMPTLIKEIRKDDDLTVDLRAEPPRGAVHRRHGDGLRLDPVEGIRRQPRGRRPAGDLNQAPVGTGPFQFVAYQKDAVIRYKANPDYWDGKQPLDDLVFAITIDSAVRMQKLQAGECQIAPYPNPADLAGLKPDPNLTVMEQPGLNVGYLAYNTQQPPFDDVKVRKALNMAINKQAIIDAVFEGQGQIAKNPIPPTMWSYNDAVEDDPYDPEAAKAMLAEAGQDGLKMKIWAMPVARPYNPNARRMAELIQADFAKVGVEVEIVSYEWGEYLKMSSDVKRDGAVLLGWTGDNGDPDNFLAVLLGCDAVGNSNRAQWCYQPFEDLIQKAKVTSGQDDRAKLYEQAQVVFKEQGPWATIAHSVVFMPMSNKVTGYKMSPFGSHRFDGVDIAE